MNEVPFFLREYSVPDRQPINSQLSVPVHLLVGIHQVSP